MILLQRPDAGTIRVLDVDLQSASAQEVLALRQGFGVTFQHGGLLASLTVLENVGLPLREHRHLARAEVNELAHSKLALSGLEADVGNQYPASLSGGMMKRAALARALVLEPELLLDEPTAGLDPESADGVGQRIQRLGENTLPEPERLLAELNVLSTSLRRLNKQTEHAPASLLFRQPPVRPGPGEIPPPGTTP